MRKYLLINLIVLSVFVGLAQNTVKNYYYYKNEKRYLELDTNYVFISFTSSDLLQNDKLSRFGSTKQHKESMNSSLKQTLNKDEDFYWAEVKLGENLPSESYSQRVSSLRQVENVQVVSPYFKSANSKRIGLSNFFYVKVKTLSDTTILQRFAKRYNTIIVKQDVFMPLWFALSCTKNTGVNALELANMFYESGMFQYAEPDLMLDDVLNAVDDPYYPSQWGLKNTGQYQGVAGIDIKAADAWRLSTGYGVNVAVIDQGIQMDHPDLQANIHTLSYDTENGTSPSIVRGDHATACAGIIGAIGNTTGIKGTAPNSRLMSVSSALNLMTPNIRQKLANGFNWSMQNGAHVISNSWGHNDLLSNYIDDAITNVITNGRNGLGCIVVFSSGNDDGRVNYPANSNPNILVVGAISPCGQRKSPSSCDGETTWGSNYGATLDVVAPGVLIPTTDRTGYDGYNPNTLIHTGNGGNKVTADYSSKDFTVWFNGTSSACPHVAGIAALILSINPNLTGQQVRDIIERTAQKVGGYSYTTTTGRPNGTWNDKMGHGLVNAYAAVSALFTISGPTTVCTSGATYTVSNLPARCTVSWSGSSNLTLSSASGNSATFVANGSGIGSVVANLSLNGCGFSVEKTVDVGIPEITSINFTNGLGEIGGSGYWCSSHTGNGYSLSASFGDPNYEVQLLTWPNLRVIETQTVSGGGSMGSPPPGYYVLNVRVIGACGYGEWVGWEVECQDCSSNGNSEYSILWPNPASTTITIKREASVESGSSYSLKKVRESTPATTTIIRIFNNQSQQVKQATLEGNESFISVADLPEGFYLVHIITGSKIEKQKLQIKR